MDRSVCDGFIGRSQLTTNFCHVSNQLTDSADMQLHSVTDGNVSRIKTAKVTCP